MTQKENLSRNFPKIPLRSISIYTSIHIGSHSQKSSSIALPMIINRLHRLTQIILKKKSYSKKFMFL